MKYNVAVVGATGMVGKKMLEVLAEQKFPIKNLYLFASKKSAGSTAQFLGNDYKVIELTKQNVQSQNIDFALFSAGSAVSKEFAPVFASNGAIVVDNSSCFRMEDNVPLVVPEVNPEDAFKHNNIIANPNCSTIQAVVALAPLHKVYGIKRIVYSTYQAVSGAGVQGYHDLAQGMLGMPPKKFAHAIFANVLPHIDDFCSDGYTKEEHKMINETRKILHAPNLPITATTVRVPVFYGHSESINVELCKPCSLQNARQCLSSAQGLIVLDDVQNALYPMPLQAQNKDEVFVGRIRIDASVPSGLNLWVVADNIRKGAATNAVQILQLLIKNKGE